MAEKDELVKLSDVISANQNLFVIIELRCKDGILSTYLGNTEPVDKEPSYMAFNINAFGTEIMKKTSSLKECIYNALNFSIPLFKGEGVVTINICINEKYKNPKVMDEVNQRIRGYINDYFSSYDFNCIYDEEVKGESNGSADA